MKFENIPQFPKANYRILIPWVRLKKTLEEYKESYNLDLNPKFQRDYVWSNSQQVLYTEHRLQRGAGGHEIFLNCPGWDGNNIIKQMTLIDGKQRIAAILSFLNNEFKVFGHYYKDFEDELHLLCGFQFNIASLEGNEVLDFYISLNSGTAHTKAELDKVRNLRQYK